MNEILIPKIRGSMLDLSHQKTFSGMMGKLIPTLVMDIIPGDLLSISEEMIIRLSPLVTPVLHEINVYTHYFFVPNDILWTNWGAFITGGEDGLNASTHPTMDFTAAGLGQVTEGDLADYMGVPVSEDCSDINALPFRAYNLIYNEWYRQQDLQTKLTVSLADGNDTTTDIDLQFRNWEIDYFTGCLPEPQKGNPVYLPLGTSAPVDGNTITPTASRVSNAGSWAAYIVGSNTPLGGPHTIISNASSLLYETDTPNSISLDPAGTIATSIDPTTMSLTADLTNATAATINELRYAVSVQRWQERNARAGGRYAEYVFAHFGVRTPDERLGRPEYLGGTKSVISISEVLQTSQTDIAGTAQGNMVGHGIAALTNSPIRKSFSEHGWVIGITSVMPRSQYQQGIPRNLSRATKFDYFHPEFVELGEQSVLMKEIFAGAALPNSTFGFQERYAEYRSIQNSVHGTMKDTGALANWHLGRIFGAEPSLDGTFLQCEPATRIFAYPSEDQILCQVLNKINAVRAMPKYVQPV